MPLTIYERRHFDATASGRHTYLLCLLSDCTFTKAFCFASILVQNMDGMGKYQSHSMLKSLPDSFPWRLRLVNFITCNYNILPPFTIYLDRIRSVGHHSLDTAIFGFSTYKPACFREKRLNG